MIRPSQGLPQYLADMQREIEGYAKEYGLDYFDTIFEVLDYQRMNHADLRVMAEDSVAGVFCRRCWGSSRCRCGCSPSAR